MAAPIRMGDLAPWDQVSLCTIPKETFFSGIVAGTQLCKGDTHRNLLAFFAPGGGLTVISLNQSAGTTQGMVIPSQVANLILTTDIHGPLTNQAWFLASSGPLNITVYETFQNDAPDPSKINDNGQVGGLILIPQGTENVSAILANNGSGSSLRRDYRWPKSQTPSDHDIPAGCWDIVRYFRQGRC